MTTWVYSLALENGHWYVGTTKDRNKRLEDHLSGEACAWTRLHRPIDTRFSTETECTSPNPGLLEDMRTKELMLRYGVYKVRGGSYSQVSLEMHQLTTLNREIRHAADKCLRCGSTSHFADSCEQGVCNMQGLLEHEMQALEESDPARGNLVCAEITSTYGSITLEQHGAGSGKT